MTQQDSTVIRTLCKVGIKRRAYISFTCIFILAINEMITIDASSATDPDQPYSNSGLELLWFCSTKNITKATDNDGRLFCS